MNRTMKATCLIIFVFIATSIDAFSQEWKWKDSISIIHEPRVLKLVDINDLLFLDTILTSISLEWKWRDSSLNDNLRLQLIQTDYNYLEPRVLKQMDYNYFLFPDTVDFRLSTFLSTAHFGGAKFASTAEFSMAQFDSVAIFTGAHFASLAEFNRAQFDSAAYFYWAKFDSIASFRSTKFTSTAAFKEAMFASTAVFNGAHFASTTNFKWAHFASTAVFNGAHFASIADFYMAKFDSTADFGRVNFNSTANFREAMFASTADFSWAKFDSTADFSLAEFNGEVFFTGATLSKFLNFSQVTRIADEIDLTKSVINPKYDTCYINLTDAAIERFRFMYQGFKLWFPPEVSIKYETKTNVYEALLKIQKDEGFTQSYEILDKEYKEFQYTDSESNYWWITGHFLNWIDKYWWGYSYDKERIVWNTILIYLLLSLINTFWLKYLTTRVYVNEKIERLRNSDSAKTWYIRALNSFGYSMFYTAVIFFGLKFDMDKLNYEENLKGRKVLNLAYFFTIYLGGFVCLAYLANYIITI